MIIKRCFSCDKWFKAKLLSYQPYCPICRKKYWKDSIENIKKARSILARNMDVYDTKYWIEKYKRYERVCRVCGARLLKKNGEHSTYKRYCSKHHYFDFNTDWTFSRHQFLENFQDKNQVLIILTAMDKGYENIVRFHRDGTYNFNYYICEKCFKPITFGDIEVHHKIPVHKLTEKNIYLIWDESNFQCLCHECHRKIDHGLKRRPKKIEKKKYFFWRDKRYRSRKIDNFF